MAMAPATSTGFLPSTSTSTASWRCWYWSHCDRQVLAEEGVVVVVVTVDVQSGSVLTGPEIITRMVYAPEAEDLLDEAYDTVAASVERALADGVRDVEALEREVRRLPGGLSTNERNVDR